MRKWLKQVLIGLGVAAGLLVAAVFLLIGLFIYEQRTEVLQTVEVPSAEAQFVLTTRLAGIGDRGWAVYRQPLGGSAKAAARGNENYSGSLFWNYTESGDHSENAHLDVVGDRYLVFSRGGFRYSLYDIIADTVLVNEVSPWGQLDHTSRGAPTDLSADKARMDRWVRDHLDRPIGAILRSPAEPLDAGRQRAPLLPR